MLAGSLYWLSLLAVVFLTLDNHITDNFHLIHLNSQNFHHILLSHQHKPHIHIEIRMVDNISMHNTRLIHPMNLDILQFNNGECKIKFKFQLPCVQPLRYLCFHRTNYQRERIRQIYIEIVQLNMYHGFARHCWSDTSR